MDGERHQQANKGKATNYKGTFNLENKIERRDLAWGQEKIQHLLLRSHTEEFPFIHLVSWTLVVVTSILG